MPLPVRFIPCVDLDELREVDIRAERILDSPDIRNEPVRRELNPSVNTLGEITDEVIGIRRRALTDAVGEHEFRVAIQCDPSILVADDGIIALHVFLFAIDEGPNLVGLDL